MILVTGSDGLVGHHLGAALIQQGLAVRAFDIRRTPDETVLSRDAVERALRGVSGIVHLAAVSRVSTASAIPGIAGAPIWTD